MRLYAIRLFFGLFGLTASAGPNTISCAAFCAYEQSVTPPKTDKDEKSSPERVYKFMTSDGPTYGKALQALYNSCEKLNGRLRLEDYPGDEGQMVVNMKSACRENPK